jgi:hypothetical protein
MDPHIGHAVEPVAQLGVEVFEIAKAPTEKEVLADIAIRAFDLALRFGPVRATRPRGEAIVLGQRHQLRVVDDVLRLLLCLPQHRRLHPIVQNLGRDPAQVLERRHVAAQDAHQILMHHVARPKITAMPEHQREQPYDLALARHGLELDLEMGKVHLRLASRWSLEAQLEARQPRSDLAHHIGERGTSAAITELTHLS